MHYLLLHISCVNCCCLCLTLRTNVYNIILRKCFSVNQLGSWSVVHAWEIIATCTLAYTCNWKWSLQYLAFNDPLPPNGLRDGVLASCPRTSSESKFLLRLGLQAHIDDPKIHLCSATDELNWHRSARLHETAMMEGYSERQEDEIEVLQAVFPAGEFVDLRLKDPWKVISKKRRLMS